MRVVLLLQQQPPHHIRSEFTLCQVFVVVQQHLNPGCGSKSDNNNNNIEQQFCA